MGEAPADEGFLATVELRYNTVAPHDGRVLLHNTTWASFQAANLPNIYALAGVGVGIYRSHRIETMNNSGWQRARKSAGLGDLHVHDLRHTVGMRLREAVVREETIADVLWHHRASMTAHYSVAQVAELYEALNRISNESHRSNRSLVMIAREANIIGVPQKSPDKSKRVTSLNL